MYHEISKFSYIFTIQEIIVQLLLNFGLTYKKESTMKHITFLLCCMIIMNMNAMLIQSLPKELMLIQSFPEEINTRVVQDIPLSPWLETLEEVNDVMKCLARLNNSWRSYINDSKNTLSLIKELSKRFGVSDIEVAGKLSIKDAQSRYAIQTSVFAVWERSDETIIHRHLDRLASKLDLNFTYSGDFCEESTLLISAVYSSKIAIAKWLIQKGVDINKCNECNERKLNPVMAALIRCPENMISLLFNQPSLDCNSVDGYGNTLLHYCIHSPHCSSQCGNQKFEIMVPIIKKLLEKGIDRNAVDNDGKTALDIANSYTFKYEPFLKILNSKQNS